MTTQDKGRQPIDEGLKPGEEIMPEKDAQRLENRFTPEEYSLIKKMLEEYRYQDKQKKFNEEHNHDGSNSQTLNANNLNWFNRINIANGNVNFADFFKIFGTYLTINGLSFKTYNADVADDDEISLPDATFGIGIVSAEGEEGALFIWQADGTVTLIANSTNVANSDSDTDLSIYDTGTQVNIKNRLGNTKTIQYLILY